MLSHLKRQSGGELQSKMILVKNFHPVLKSAMQRYPKNFNIPFIDLF